jgi:hypothetical protein
MSLPPLLRLSPETALGFDDVLLEPDLATVPPEDMDITTCITKGIPLQMPAVFLFLDSTLDLKALSESCRTA